SFVFCPLVCLFKTTCSHVASGNVVQFGLMISCVQPGVNPLKYDNYGCWCGFGGRGTPRDQVDKCCQVHDYCYRQSKQIRGCISYTSTRALMVAPVQIGNYSLTDSTVSPATNNRCQAAVCECDREAAYCFAKATYNPGNKNLNRKVC
uniref:Phospholipase A2 n=1 Tax=Monopterus albus TaxID=43700 RepID=A0A3Q3K9E8_MONAL